MFNGKEGSLIPLRTAETLVDDYRALYPSKIKGAFFGKKIINELLAQEGAMGIRIYLGDEDENFKYVVVAADGSENDILDKIADMAVPCPSRCSNTGGLK